MKNKYKQKRTENLYSLSSLFTITAFIGTNAKSDMSRFTQRDIIAYHCTEIKLAIGEYNRGTCFIAGASTVRFCQKSANLVI